MRKPYLYLIGLLALLIVAGLIDSTLSGEAVAASSPDAASANNRPSPHLISQPVGVPAIVPSLGATNASTPAFTASDVEQYIKSNPMPHNLAANPQAVIVKILFILFHGEDAA